VLRIFFIEICNIYANQMVIKVTIIIINSDQLSHSYDDLYVGVTFWDIGYIYKVILQIRY